jgi:prepilin-type N-terminal cleavage/methylation domain-containing protein/prepilin-type processing-associated H-X9-DG protein
MSQKQGFTLIELLVVIAVIAVLMGIMMPGLRAAKQLATGSACLANEKTLLTAWFLYADDYDGKLVSNNACYDTSLKNDDSAWVYQPKLSTGQSLPSPAPATITKEDRFRGIRAGTLWKYVEDVGAYHCPGDNRASTQIPPRDCYRSYSISYAFGHLPDGNYLNHAYQAMQEVKSGARYYVFVEEEHNGSRYGENEGGWHLLGWNEPRNPGAWQFYDPLASYHLKSSTFGFADGHAAKRKWADPRTLEFIQTNKDSPGAHSGIATASADNLDLAWLIEHFMSKERVLN